MSELLNQSALEALAATQESIVRVERTMGSLEQLVKAGRMPATYVVKRLTAATPIVRDEAGDTSRSIGLYNPTGATIFLGVGGGAAKANANAWSVPATSALILPLAIEDLEIGAAAADLAAGDAVVFLLRFTTVQAFFFGAI